MEEKHGNLLLIMKLLDMLPVFNMYLKVKEKGLLLLELRDCIIRQMEE